ncbi:hypothetical protein ES703_35480 [subsurface metagenome]
MFYKSFSVTGVANVTTFDDGLISSVAEPKKIMAILISVSKWRNNNLEGWIETNRILEISDFVLNTSEDEGCGVAIIRIPIDEIIKPGMIFKIAINCGATATNIFGAYEYELTS